MVHYRGRLDGAFGALADPTRRAIVERLAHGERTVGELARPFAMSLPAVLKHVRVLQEAGIVRATKVGRARICRLDTRALERVERWAAERRAMWETRLDRLGRVVTTEERQR